MSVITRAIIALTIITVLAVICYAWFYTAPLRRMGSNLDLIAADLPADDWARRLNDSERFVRAAAIAGLARAQDRRAGSTQKEDSPTRSRRRVCGQIDRQKPESSPLKVCIGGSCFGRSCQWLVVALRDCSFHRSYWHDASIVTGYRSV
jgi:hypothetical protein